MTGTERLCATLRELGVRHVFGLPGSQNAGLFSAFPDHRLRPVLATSELAASFMANGYARASGRVGVLATIPGPGFTYALPGLAEARLDSVPLLHLVGAPSTFGGDRFQHQAIDQDAIARPLVKEIVEIRTPGEMGSGLKRAHAAALATEPGPVLVHLSPESLKWQTGAVAESEPPDRAAAEPGPTGAPTGTARPGAEQGQAWWPSLRPLLASAKRPVLFVGFGAAAWSDSIRELAEKLNAPVFTTVSGRGVLPENHPNAMEFDPARGRVDELNRLLEKADLILGLGCKLSHNGTAGFSLRMDPAKLVLVNPDPLALDANYPAVLAIPSSVGEVVRAALQDLGHSPSPTVRWTDPEIAEWKSLIASPARPAYPEPRLAGVAEGSPRIFFEALREALPDNGVLVTDSGLHQILARRYFRSHVPGGLMVPADFQSMGFGVPAALGVKLASPDRPVAAVVGDGGFLISAMELLTARREEIPVVIVVFNDGFLNLIRLQQLGDHGRPVATRVQNPDLRVLAEAFGLGFRRLEDDPESTLRSALEEKAPVLVEVRLGDSSAIRSARRRGRARWLTRRVLGEPMVRRLKAFLGR